jgi:hypothetical protein
MFFFVEGWRLLRSQCLILGLCGLPKAQSLHGLLHIMNPHQRGAVLNRHERCSHTGPNALVRLWHKALDGSQFAQGTFARPPCQDWTLERQQLLLVFEQAQILINGLAKSNARVKHHAVFGNPSRIQGQQAFGQKCFDRRKRIALHRLLKHGLRLAVHVHQANTTLGMLRNNRQGPWLA